jgi:hypothetical protein
MNSDTNQPTMNSRFQNTRIPTPSLPLLRIILIVLNAVASASFLLELIFLRHFNETLQWVPIIAVILGIIGVIASLQTNTVTRAIVVFAALGLLGAGGLGALVHLIRNAGYAEGKGLWAILTGPAPVIAPLSLANVGLMLLLTLWLSRPTESINKNP